MADKEPQTTHSPIDNILAAIHVLTNRVGRVYLGQLEAEFGITPAEWRTMLTLHQNPQSTAADIINQWAMDKMAISRAIRRMEQRGWVRRTVNPKDRRSLKLSLTAAGRRQYDTVLPAANALYREIVSALSRKDQAALRSYLAQLIAQTGQITGPENS